MAVFLEMPKFGLTMEEGTIVAWLKKEGELVVKGEPLLEVATEKITNTVEAPAGGILKQILVKEEETVECGVYIGVIDDGTGAAETCSESSRTVAGTLRSTADPVSVSSICTAGAEQCTAASQQVKITPKARGLAEKHGVDYYDLCGTGIDGAITLADVKKCLAGPPLQTQGYNEIKMSEMRRAISRKMMESLHSSAQTTLAMDMDVTNLDELYRNNKSKFKAEGIKLSYTAFLLKTTALALRKHPRIRTFLAGDTFKECNQINIGVAVDIEGGLIVPVLKNVDVKDIKTICLDLEEITQKARNHQLVAEDLEQGTITLSNLGMFGIRYFTPILNYPQSAILGIGALEQRVVVIEGGLHIRSLISVSMTHDHRVFDGAEAAKFLNTFKNILAAPDKLFDV